MKKLFLAAFAAFFLTLPVPEQANADEARGFGDQVRRVFGEYVTFSGTYNEVDFGFASDYVRICIEDDSARVWYRLGLTLSTLDGSESGFPPANATDFKTGGTRMAGQAVPLFGGGDGTDTQCFIDAIQTNGMVFAVDSAGGASLDVSAYRFR